jgi:hypothetical protein
MRDFNGWISELSRHHDWCELDLQKLLELLKSGVCIGLEFKPAVFLLSSEKALLIPEFYLLISGGIICLYNLDTFLKF